MHAIFYLRKMEEACAGVLDVLNLGWELSSKSKSFVLSLILSLCISKDKH